MSKIHDLSQAFINGDRKKVINYLSKLPRYSISKIEVELKPDWCLRHHHKEKVTLLHLSVYHGWLDVCKKLIMKYSCNANAQPTSQFGCSPSPSHYAAAHGYLQILKYLISVQKSDPNVKDGFGKIPLHLASRGGHFSVVKFLVNECNCDPFNKTGGGTTPLHYACENGHINIVKFLMSIKSENVQNDDGETPLHYACRAGQYEIMIYLISQEKCDATCTDKMGNNILHKACTSGKVEMVEYIMSLGSIDLNSQNHRGRTPLHNACYSSHTEVVRFLLSTGVVNPLQRDADDNTPIEIIPSYSEQRYEILRLFQPFSQCRIDFPIETYSKVYFCGNPATGKSSLAEIISYRCNKPLDHQYHPFLVITDVKPHTAGIIPHHFESHEVGNIVLYDFAGHPEYYSSHAAVLENTMLSSPAVFAIFVNGTASRNTIQIQFYYWANFIKNVISKTKIKSEIITVISHVDQMQANKKELKAKESFVDRIAKRALPPQQLHYKGCIGVDCHRPGGIGIADFMKRLSASCKAVIEKSESISFYCHVLYAFLQQLKVNAISLQDLSLKILNENDASLPSNKEILINILGTLSDKGMILFLRNTTSDSWIIINKNSLLQDINGTLFAPDDFDEHQSLSSNTGIVPIYALKCVFPDYDINMLVSFLITLEFCHTIEANTFKTIATNITMNIFQEDTIFYFPALVSVESPEKISCNADFGWCLWCPDAYQFFSTRFVQVLLLRIAYKYALKCSSYIGTIQHSSSYKLHRSCVVWKNGIQFERDFVKATIIISDLNRSVILLIKSLESGRSKFRALIDRCTLIAEILLICKEFCPYCDVQECLISPSDILIHQDLSELRSSLYSIDQVARAALLNVDKVTNVLKANEISVSFILGEIEPYLRLSLETISDLFNQSMSKNIIPSETLKCIEEKCFPLQIKDSNDINYESLCNYLNKYSVFAGRNPIVSYPVFT